MATAETGGEEGGPEVDVWGVVHTVTYPVQDVGGRNYGGYSRDGRRGRMDVPEVDVWGVVHMVTYPVQDVGGHDGASDGGEPAS